MSKRATWGVVVLLGCLAAPALASTVIGLSVEDQARLSRYVVLGEVQSLEAVDHPQLGIETAVTLLVKQSLKGSVAAGQTVVFHTRQGEVAGTISEAPGEAHFNVGQAALIFIEDVDGRLYNLGLSLGVWSVQERDGAAVAYTRDVADGLEVVGDVELELGPIAARDMASRVEWAVRHTEIEHPMLRSIQLQGR